MTRYGRGCPPLTEGNKWRRCTAFGCDVKVECHLAIYPCTLNLLVRMKCEKWQVQARIILTNVPSADGNQQIPISRFPLAYSVGGQKSNMFNTDSRQTIINQWLVIIGHWPTTTYPQLHQCWSLDMWAWDSYVTCQNCYFDSSFRFFSDLMSNPLLCCDKV